MKIWISKNSEIPVREQLITQIKLGIAGGDLPTGEKLPSTREIARRFEIHANTVSNAYQHLCKKGWLEFKKGSGFFVCDAKNGDLETTFDRIIADFLQTARKQGFTITEVKKRLEVFSEIRPTEKVLLIEPDVEFRKILTEEIRSATGLEVGGANLDEFQQNVDLHDWVLTAMLHEKTNLLAVLPPNKTCIFLHANSVADAMKGQQRPRTEDLIAIVSGWGKFLLMARTLLIAANLDPEAIVARKTGEPGWQKGLGNASLIICDSLTSRFFAHDPRVRIFQLLGKQSLDEVAAAAGQTGRGRG